MQAAGTALPKFDRMGGNSKTAPMGWCGNRFVAELCFHLTKIRLQGSPIGHGGALRGGPGSQLAAPGAGLEIGFGFFPRSSADLTGYDDLSFEGEPGEEEGGARVGGQMLTLGALVVGEEYESPLIDPFQESGAGSWSPISVHGGDGHSIGLNDSRGYEYGLGGR